MPPERAAAPGGGGVQTPPREEPARVRVLRGAPRPAPLAPLLPPGPRYFPADQITDQQERFIAAELIREQVLHYTHQEVPHSVAVQVEEFKERRPDLTYIGANVFVERESQKGIVIGQGGQMIKCIGRAARREIEQMVGHKVYLELWVKVKKHWRRDEDELRRLGYAPPRKK